MLPKTLHVYSADGSWLVKSEGKAGKVYSTRREAIDAARNTVKSAGAGQFLVHGEDGQLKHWAYKMTPIQDPPKMSPRAADISRAVAKLALQRVQFDSPREHSSKS